MYDDSWKRTPCKETTRALDRHGYGVVNITGGEQTGAHRFAYEQFHSIDLPRDVFVLHKCDNRKCIEVTHLFTGSEYDNYADAVNKNRIPENMRRKLTADDVFEIRVLLATGKYGCESLARRYGVNKSTIKEIRDYKIWKRVKIF